MMALLLKSLSTSVLDYLPIIFATIRTCDSYYLNPLVCYLLLRIIFSTLITGNFPHNFYDSCQISEQLQGFKILSINMNLLDQIWDLSSVRFPTVASQMLLGGSQAGNKTAPLFVTTSATVPYV